MRIFLAVLLALLLADTITGSPTSRRTRREKKTRKRKSSSGGSRTLLKQLKVQLNELKLSEETRDNNIEAKMDKAINDLKDSVAEMHSNLNKFIAEDKKINYNMKSKIEGMSSKVSALDNAVMNAIDSINGQLQDQPDDDMMTHQADHHDGGHGGHDTDEAVHEPEIRRRGGRPMPEESIDEGSTSGNGEDPAQGPVAIEEPVSYQDGSSGFGSGDFADNGDYGYGDYDA